MAVWTQHFSKTIFSDAGQGGVATDGTFFYGNDETTGTEVYRYDPETDTQLTIGDEATDWPASSGFTGFTTGVTAWFKGNLYKFIGGNGTTQDRSQIWKYNGTPHSWTKVFSSNVQNSGMGYTANEIIIFTRELDGVWISTDGTSYIQGTILGGGTDTPDINASGQPFGFINKTFIVKLRTDISNPASNFLKLSGTDLIDIGNSVDEVRLTNSVYHWVHVSGAIRYSSDLSTFSVPDAGRVPRVSINTNQTMGDDNSGATNVYFFDSPPAWADQGGPITTELFGFIRLDNSKVYAFRDNNELWISDTTISGPTVPIATVNARFYQGAGSLSEKFTLPFTGVAPKGFTLDVPLGTVVIGADGNNDDPIVFSESPYVTGTVSDTNFPTTTAINVLDWI